uniref:Uncharacterized protein n=1 Tax=viral metagenome TaxID=1070528 RepID=A0A6C0JTR5_9ZZZZ
MLFSPEKGGENVFQKSQIFHIYKSSTTQCL